uniref:Gp138 family membrane-puncturing spike protein n=1 Tax=uncultured Cetobacterium sp. TaxID=527638 RepID=UPI002616AEFC
VKSFAERFPVKKGDIAMLQFSEVTLEKILDSGVYEEVVDTSKFDISDAVITSFLSKSKDELSNDNKDDYCLYNLNSGHKIIFKENGEIEVFTKKLSLNVEESIEIETPIINALNTQFNVKGIKAESIVTDTLNSLKSAIIKGINFISHVHSGVKGGPDKTQGPQ